MDINIGRGLTEARALAATHKAMLAAYVGIGVVIPFLLLSSEPLFSLRAILTILDNPGLQFGGSIAGPLYLLAIVGAIVAGAMLAAVSRSTCLIEPVFFWPDALEDIHCRSLEADLRDLLTYASGQPLVLDPLEEADRIAAMTPLAAVAHMGGGK